MIQDQGVRSVNSQLNGISGISLEGNKKQSTNVYEFMLYSNIKESKSRKCRVNKVMVQEYHQLSRV